MEAHCLGGFLISSCTEHKVLVIAEENFGEGVKLDTPLRSLGDSLELANLILELEHEFGLDIPDADICKITDLQGVVKYVEAHG